MGKNLFLALGQAPTLEIGFNPRRHIQHGQC